MNSPQAGLGAAASPQGGGAGAPQGDGRADRRRPRGLNHNREPSRGRPRCPVPVPGSPQGPAATPSPPSPHKQTTRGAGRENGRESLFSPPIGSSACLSSQPRLPQRDPLFLLALHHVTPPRRPRPSALRAVCKAKKKKPHRPLNGPRGGASGGSWREGGSKKQLADWPERAVQISTARRDWLRGSRRRASRSGGSLSGGS